MTPTRRAIARVRTATRAGASKDVPRRTPFVGNVAIKVKLDDAIKLERALFKAMGNKVYEGKTFQLFLRADVVGLMWTFLPERPDEPGR